MESIVQLVAGDDCRNQTAQSDLAVGKAQLQEFRQDFGTHACGDHIAQSLHEVEHQFESLLREVAESGIDVLLFGGGRSLSALSYGLRLVVAQCGVVSDQVADGEHQRRQKCNEPEGHADLAVLLGILLEDLNGGQDRDVIEEPADKHCVTSRARTTAE